MRAMDVVKLAPHLEKLLHRVASGKAGVDTLSAAASGNAQHLADALWMLVRENKGALVGHERAALAMLTPGHFDANDFISLLRQLKKANLFWFERWDDRVDGLAYHGWSKELEVMLDKLLASDGDRTPLEWADVSEPAGSSVLFALGRRGIVQAALMPPDAMQRFGRAFLLRASWCPEQFNGWERLWDEATFARAVFADVGNIKEVGVFPDTLEPLVAHATPAQLALVVEKLIWPDHRAIGWLAARGKAIVPLLQTRLEELLTDAKKGHWISDRTGRHVGALARIRAQEPWPAKWIPLTKAMLVHDTAGLEDVLRTVDVATREEMLLAHLSKQDNWRNKLWPLAKFPTQRLVDAVVKLIRSTPKAEEWDYEREPLFKTLGAMGDLGQTALETLLDEKDQTEGAIANLVATKSRAVMTLPLLESTNDAIASSARRLWLDLSDEDRIELLDRHLDAMPPFVAAQVLAHTHHHPRTGEIAARVPETDTNRALRRFCMTRPDALRPLIDAMAAVPEEAVKRAASALAPIFEPRRDYSFNLKETLSQFGPDDLPVVLRVTACRMGSRYADVSTLCKHFWPARSEIPWVAVFWWSDGWDSTLTAAECIVGKEILAPLRARIETDHVQTTAWQAIFGILARHDPLGSVDTFIRMATNPAVSRYIVDPMIVCLENGSAAARDWLAKALLGKGRELALEILNRHAVPEVLPVLQSLEKQKLPAKVTKLLQSALAAQKTRGPTIVRDGKTLSARAIHTTSGTVESLHISHDGHTIGAHAAGHAYVWQGKRHASIEKLGNVRIEMSLDGRFLLVVDEFNVHVYEPWENPKEPRVTLHPDDGLGYVVPMPGGRVLTLCAAHNAYTPLTSWDLETGKEMVHKSNGFPVHAAIIDDERYVVGDMNSNISIRQLNGGKVVGKLQTWGDGHGDGICMVASGNAGKIVAALFFDGSLMIWDISGAKVKALCRIPRAAPRALVADPGSSWVVTPSVNEVITWKDGQRARSLVGAGPVAARPDWHFEEAGLAVFVRPNILAVGGERVDLWDLERSEHLGTLDKPVTTLVSAAGKLLAGDAQGTIWEVDLH